MKGLTKIYYLRMTFILSYGLSFLSITGVYLSLSPTCSLVTFDIFTATLTHGKSATRQALHGIIISNNNKILKSSRYSLL